MNYSRHSKQQAAITTLSERLALPLDYSSAPASETPLEGDVRAFESVLTLYQLNLVAGVLSPRKQRALAWLMQGIESRLVQARRELKFERGDW